MLGLLHQLFHPVHSYALCAVARSGSHLLTAALSATHRAGRPLQYFNEQLAARYAARFGLNPARFADYVRGIVMGAATPNSVFGFRIESWDLPGFIQRLRETGEFGPPEVAEVDLLNRAFPRLRCIQLTRRDKLRQAISKARAMQTNLWVPGSGTPAAELKFDPALIEHCLESARVAEETWKQFFHSNGIEPLAITYEELCADYAGTVTRVLDFLRVRPPRNFSLGPPRTVRQADALTEEWMQRFLALAEDGKSKRSAA